MNSQIAILCLTAASIAFMHTISGPDHYLPFVVLSKARSWSKIKTIWITLLCGIGHVASSVLLGLLGIVAGVELAKLQYFDSLRGNIAGWLFIGFGLAYALWGLRMAIKNKPHTHAHFHLNGKKHVHEHTHFMEHTHPHTHDNSDISEKSDYKNLTPWILFVIFIMGPVEPLIPLIMLPGIHHSTIGVAGVVASFSVIHIATMTTIVLLMTTGLSFVKFEKIERYMHTLAGSAILISGVAIQFFGL